MDELKLYSIFWNGRFFARTKAASVDAACEVAYKHILRHKDSIDRSELSARLSTDEEAVTPNTC